ncbi:MAG: thioredoxin domain-containing protein [bacterium]
MSQNILIPAVLIVSGLIVASAVYYVSSKNVTDTAGATSDLSLVRPPGSDDHILGNPAAPVIIVEYSDFDCPFCKSFNDTLHRIVNEYGANGQVAWIFRNFPLTELHPNAQSAAEASECVANLGGNEAYWKFSDLLFANQPADPSTYPSLATQAGVSGDAVTACLSAGTAKDRVAADSDNAKAAGANGTPYSVILVRGSEPVLINGAFPYDTMKQKVEAALAAVK